MNELLDNDPRAKPCLMLLSEQADRARLILAAIEPKKCPDDQCDYEPTDGLLDRNGYETRKCCNCGDVADIFVRTYYGDCDGPSLLSNGRGGFSPEAMS